MATDEETPLLVGNFPPSKILNHKRDVHILSLAFLLLFSAYGAAQNLESTINTEGDLGTISLGILYLSFAVCSLVASLVVRKLGCTNALVLGTTGYWLFVAANLKANWYTMVPASLYVGFASSVIWVGQGTYLTSTARSHANDYYLHEESVIGKFNGEFWATYALNQFVGNLITFAILRDGEVTFSSTMNTNWRTAVCVLQRRESERVISTSVIGGVIFTSVFKGGSTSGTTLLFVVFLCIMTLGIILMCFLTKRKCTEEKGLQDSTVSVCISVLSSSKSVAKLFTDRRILLSIPLIAYSGLQQAFVWADYTKFIVEPTLGEAGVGGAMAVYGVFDAICSLAAGRFTSGLPSITVIVLSGAFVQAAAYIWLLLSCSVTGGLPGLIYPLLIAALLGIGDGVFNTQLCALLGILFKHDLEGAFSQLKLWQSLSIAFVFFVSPYISLQTMVVIMVAALAISVTGFLLLMLREEKAFSVQAS